MFKTQTYFVEYQCLLEENSIQIEAQSIVQAEEIFKRNFQNCTIKNVETTDDISKMIVDDMMVGIREQLKSV